MGLVASAIETVKRFAGIGKPKHVFLEFAEIYAEEVVKEKSRGKLSNKLMMAESKAKGLYRKITRKLIDIKTAEDQLAEKRTSRQALATEIMALPKKAAAIKFDKNYKAAMAAIDREINTKANRLHNIDLDIAALERKTAEKTDLETAQTILQNALFSEEKK